MLGPEDVVVARRAEITTGPRISGSLEPREEAVVRAEVAGTVLSVGPELGQAVRRGEVLATIESDALEDAVASARAAVEAARQELVVAERDMERTEHLVDVGALPERDLDTAESAVVVAQSKVEEARSRVTSAQEELGDSTVRASIAGVIAERAVNAGDVVQEGTALFTVIDPSTMRLEGSVPAEELPAVSVGAPVRFEVRGYPDQHFFGTIAWIAPAADPDTRQVPLLVEIPNQDRQLVARLFAEGRVATRSREALVVPAQAVDLSGQRPTVTLVRDGRVERVPVTLGMRDPSTEQIEVRAGVEPGEVLLVRGAANLPPGTPVRVPERLEGEDADAVAATK